MSKKYCLKGKKLLGVLAICFGTGVILSIVIPFWGWIIVVGIALIVGGWYLIDNY